MQLLQRETVNGSFAKPHATGIGLGPITSLVETDCPIQEKHISDCCQIFYAKLIDNFSHESDVTSLKTPF